MPCGFSQGKERIMIQNINDRWGMDIKFDTVEDMEKSIKDSGYELPECGLIEGVDYKFLDQPAQTWG